MIDRAPTFRRKLAEARERAVKLAIKKSCPVVVYRTRAGQPTFRVLPEAQAEAEDVPAEQILIRVEAR